MGASAAVQTLPIGRAFFADERGVVLRATWHLDRGFVNMSIWRDDSCVATFQLAVQDSARLAAFLVEGLGDATASLLDQQRQVALTALPPPPASATASGRARSGGLQQVILSGTSAVTELARTVWYGRPTR
jgi:hypothetical protein